MLLNEADQQYRDVSWNSQSVSLGVTHIVHCPTHDLVGQEAMCFLLPETHPRQSLGSIPGTKEGLSFPLLETSADPWGISGSRGSWVHPPEVWGVCLSENSWYVQNRVPQAMIPPAWGIWGVWTAPGCLCSPFIKQIDIHHNKAATITTAFCCNHNFRHFLCGGTKARKGDACFHPICLHYMIPVTTTSSSVTMAIWKLVQATKLTKELE